MVRLPRSDDQVKFDNGGVLLNKASTQIWLQFHSQLNRVITEIPVPYYVFEKANKKETESMIETAWNAACEFASSKSLSRPDRKTVSNIAKAAQELLDK